MFRFVQRHAHNTRISSGDAEREVIHNLLRRRPSHQNPGGEVTLSPESMDRTKLTGTPYTFPLRSWKRDRQNKPQLTVAGCPFPKYTQTQRDADTQSTLEPEGKKKKIGEVNFTALHKNRSGQSVSGFLEWPQEQSQKSCLRSHLPTP